MILKWKRVVDEIGGFKYQGNTMTFNHETGKHEPIYTISKSYKGTWNGYKKGELVRFAFGNLDYVKRVLQSDEDKNPLYISEADESERLAWTYKAGDTISSYITAERISGRLYVSEDGKAIVSETRYPDGRIETERREYENAEIAE